MRFPLRKSNITVGANNVWLDWIYDPNAIPPDSLEPNDTMAQATAVAPGRHTFSGNIHDDQDVDLFRIGSASSGELRAILSFKHADGDIDLLLRDTSGTVVTSSTSTSDVELVSHMVTRGQTWFVEVRGKGGQTNGSYTLELISPVPQPPQAINDRRTIDVGQGAATIDVLANDTDPDGNPSLLTVELVEPVPPEVTLTPGQHVQLVPSPGVLGPVVVRYRITDDQGLQDDASATFFVIDLSSPAPWQNPNTIYDVDGDSFSAPIDALIIINDINTRGSRQLPVTPDEIDQIFGFVDVSGDGWLTALDALIVINFLNSPSGGGEGEQGNPPVDDAIIELVEPSDWWYAAGMIPEPGAAGELLHPSRRDRWGAHVFSRH